MKLARLPLALATAFCTAALLAPLAPAAAHDDDRHDRRNDDRGDAVRDLLRAIKRGKVIDLSHAWAKDSPVASVNPPYSFELGPTHANTRGAFGDGGQLSFTAELQHWSGQHGAPSIDAIGHIGRDGKLYGGLDAAASTSNPDGIGASGVGANLAIDQFPEDLLITRGVLLDVARLVNGDDRPLPETFEIRGEHLAQAAKKQRVRVQRGDTVFIRTGWGPYFVDDAAKYAGASSPGPSLDGADWLIKQGARIVGNDTLTFEQRPPIVTSPKFQVFPVHMRLITDSGIFIIENLNLEALAKARAYEFVAVIPPLKIKGGTGSALRALAIVPRED
jgi:kynurenine formamidase